MSLSFKNCFVETMPMEDLVVPQLKSSMHVLTLKRESPPLLFERRVKNTSLHLR